METQTGRGSSGPPPDRLWGERSTGPLAPGRIVPHGGRALVPESSGKPVREFLVLSSEPGYLLPVGVQLLAQGLDGSALGGRRLGRRHGFDLPEPLDLGPELGQLVEP